MARKAITALRGAWAFRRRPFEKDKIIGTGHNLFLWMRLDLDMPIPPWCLGAPMPALSGRSLFAWRRHGWFGSLHARLIAFSWQTSFSEYTFFNCCGQWSCFGSWIYLSLLVILASITRNLCQYAVLITRNLCQCAVLICPSSVFCLLKNRCLQPLALRGRLKQHSGRPSPRSPRVAP